jgi:hypothetical protein
MPDLHDEPDLAGNGSTAVSDHHDSMGDDTSPTSVHRASKTSEGDPPKKKRKVNHGTLLTMTLSSGIG